MPMDTGFGRIRARRSLAGALCASAMLLLAGCETSKAPALPENPFAPAIDPRGESVDGLIVGHRLMAAKEYQLALDAFTRAAATHGMSAEVLVGLGSANLGLGRLNQSEKLLRRAVETAPDWPEAWNNLAVVVMERGRTGEAAKLFEKAYALDNGQNDSIRDNLRLALAKLDNTVYDEEADKSFQLVRHGSTVYQISASPAQEP